MEQLKDGIDGAVSSNPLIVLTDYLKNNDNYWRFSSFLCVLALVSSLELKTRTRRFLQRVYLHIRSSTKRTGGS